jgi:hypothetical protein
LGPLERANLDHRTAVEQPGAAEPVSQIPEHWIFPCSTAIATELRSSSGQKMFFSASDLKRNQLMGTKGWKGIVSNASERG